jgi:hypothetical protein
MSSKTVPKHRKQKFINRQKFKTLRHKTLLSNSRRKTYKRVDGKSNISQHPFLPSTPPKLHTIFEDESDEDSEREPTPIQLHRRRSSERIKDDIIRQATATRSYRTPPSQNRTMRSPPPLMTKKQTVMSRMVDTVKRMFR